MKENDTGNGVETLGKINQKLRNTKTIKITF